MVGALLIDLGKLPVEGPSLDLSGGYEPDSKYAAATFFGTHIAHASVTSSRISASSTLSSVRADPVVAQVRRGGHQELVRLALDQERPLVLGEPEAHHRLVARESDVHERCPPGTSPGRGSGARSSAAGSARPAARRRQRSRAASCPQTGQDDPMDVSRRTVLATGCPASPEPRARRCARRGRAPRREGAGQGPPGPVGGGVPPQWRRARRASGSAAASTASAAPAAGGSSAAVRASPSNAGEGGLLGLAVSPTSAQDPLAVRVLLDRVGQPHRADEVRHGRLGRGSSCWSPASRWQHDPQRRTAALRSRAACCSPPPATPATVRVRRTATHSAARSCGSPRTAASRRATRSATTSGATATATHRASPSTGRAALGGRARPERPRRAEPHREGRQLRLADRRGRRRPRPVPGPARDLADRRVLAQRHRHRTRPRVGRRPAAASRSGRSVSPVRTPGARSASSTAASDASAPCRRLPTAACGSPPATATAGVTRSPATTGSSASACDGCCPVVSRLAEFILRRRGTRRLEGLAPQPPTRVRRWRRP